MFASRYFTPRMFAARYYPRLSVAVFLYELASIRWPAATGTAVYPASDSQVVF